VVGTDAAFLKTKFIASEPTRSFLRQNSSRQNRRDVFESFFQRVGSDAVFWKVFFIASAPTR
jgi:hypothetical protein